MSCFKVGEECEFHWMVEMDDRAYLLSFVDESQELVGGDLAADVGAF